MKKNSELLKVENDCEVICADARNLLENKKEFDLIFLDPPYSEESLPIIKNLFEKNFIHEKTLLVVEMKSGKELFSLLLGHIGIQVITFRKKSDFSYSRYMSFENPKYSEKLIRVGGSGDGSYLAT